MRQTSLTRLYEAHRESLSLVHVSGPIGARLSVAEERIWPADLVGHLNLIHPTRLQVLGADEAREVHRERVGERFRDGAAPSAARLRAGRDPVRGRAGAQ